MVRGVRVFAVSVLLATFSCNRESPVTADKPIEPAPTALAQPAPDPLRDEYIGDVMAFTGQTYDQVKDQMKLGSEPLKKEWEAWEAKGPMSEARIKEFYKQTKNYIYELGEWHINVPGKRESDAQLVKDLQGKGLKNVLDFGGGVGLVAIPLARAGFDVTLADLDSTSLEFAASRAKRHGDKLKIWKTDVEPMPPDPKYDVILALDVLEHLPKEELITAVDKLVRLKHAKTLIVMSAPFGRTATHPMHLDADAHTKAQVERLQTEFSP